jgi:hypothetical protein
VRLARKNKPGSDLKMSRQSEILASTAEAILVGAKLERIELPTLLTICVELLTICARRSVEIDPAAAAMVAYARDEIVERTSSYSTSEINSLSSTAQTTRGRVKRASASYIT